jgi:hypothetical protein
VLNADGQSLETRFLPNALSLFVSVSHEPRCCRAESNPGNPDGGHGGR